MQTKRTTAYTTKSSYPLIGWNDYKVLMRSDSGKHKHNSIPMISEPFISISKEQLSQLPSAEFKGKLCLIENESDISAAIADLRNSDVVGFDTETRPSFKKGQTHTVSLIQLSTRSTCYLFRINHTGLDSRIVDFLEDPGVLKIGLSIHDDFHNLNKLQALNPQGFIDLQNYVKDFGIADNSLTKIFAVLFGKRISKGQRLTNWEAEHLTDSQQAYAALDAMACIEIYDFLRSGEFRFEDSSYIVYPSPEEEIPEDGVAEN